VTTSTSRHVQHMRSPELADILEDLLLTAALDVDAPPEPAEHGERAQPGRPADLDGATKPDDGPSLLDRIRVVFEPVEISADAQPPAG
jgi:hypothetical protein